MLPRREGGGDVSTYNAHIFKQRNVGEREEVKLKIFGPDGVPLDLGAGGDGGSVVYFEGQTDLMGPIPGDESFFMDITFDSGVVDHLVGMTIEDGGDLGSQIRGPAGVYVAKLSPSWLGWNTTPTEGLGQVSLIHNDDVNGLNNYIMSHETNALHLSEGFGDAQFQAAEHEKIGLGIVLNPGKFRLQASQNTPTPEDVYVGIKLSIAKI